MKSEGFLFLSFSAGLDPLWFWSLELFSSVTFWHLYLWESETGSGSSSGLIAAEFSYFQTPFILFYFISSIFLHLFVCCQHFESFLPPAASCDSEGFGQFVIFILYFKNKFNNKHSETFHVFKIWHQNILNIYNLFLLLNLWQFFLLMKRFLRHSELFFCSVWFWKFLLKWSFSSGLWNWICHIIHWNFDLDSFLFWSLKATFSRWKSTNI